PKAAFIPITPFRGSRVYFCSSIVSSSSLSFDETLPLEGVILQRGLTFEGEAAKKSASLDSFFMKCFFVTSVGELERKLLRV
ncbi:hypothetical protein, partial [Bartonella sp. AA2SXKL]|uniref:hypothetical protein n=1 Tax=Bartonella sp. AA2SXKL TaxID=3243432 RepID=UPI0035CFF7E0